MTDHDKQTMTYEQAGIAAMLPGMVHMLALMQAEIDRMREMLGYAQANGAAPKRGRLKIEISPEGMAAKKRASSSYWAKMTPEKRSAEMRRRGAIRKDRKTPVAGYWEKMTPEERSAEMKRRMARRGRAA